MTASSAVVRGLVATLVLGCLVPAVAAGQDATAPRTPWGAPDLGGVWDFRTITPLERSAALKDKAVLTAEEAAAFTRQTLESRNADRRDGGAGLQACEARRKPCPSDVYEARTLLRGVPRNGAGSPRPAECLKPEAQSL